MRTMVISLFAIVLAVGGSTALGQELSAETQRVLEGAERVSGTFNNLQQQFEAVVVGDRSFFVGATVWVDGKQYRTDSLDQRLESGETVVLQLSGERRNGYPVVDNIKTTP